MYEHFCDLAISLEKICFQKEHDLAHKYFLNIDENFCFTDNVSKIKINHYFSFLKKKRKKIQWRCGS